MYDRIKMHLYRRCDLFVLSFVAIVACLLVIETASSQCIRRNLAYGQAASQSSTEHQATANLAVDGNEHSFSSTIPSDNPYWELTFEEPEQVEDVSVQLYISELFFWDAMKPETFSIKTSRDSHNFTLEETKQLEHNTPHVNYKPILLFSITSKIVKSIRIQVNETRETVLRISEVEVYGPQRTPDSMQSHPFTPSFSILLSNVKEFPTSCKHNLSKFPAKVEIDVHVMSDSEERMYHSSNFFVPGYAGRQIIYRYNHVSITIAIVSINGQSLKDALPPDVYIRVRAWKQDDFPTPFHHGMWHPLNMKTDTVVIQRQLNKKVLPDLVVVQVLDHVTSLIIEGKGYQSIWRGVSSDQVVRDVLFGFNVSTVEITFRKALDPVAEADFSSTSSATRYTHYRVMAWTFDHATLHSITTFETIRATGIKPYYFHLDWSFSTFMVSGRDSQMVYYGMSMTSDELPLYYSVDSITSTGQRMISLLHDTLPVTLNVSVTTWLFLKPEDCICSTDNSYTPNSIYEGQDRRYNTLDDSAPFTCKKDRDTYVRGTCGKDCKWHVPHCSDSFCDESKLLSENAKHIVNRQSLKWVTYECKEGYALSGGNNLRVCQTNGQWSEDKPTCRPAVCQLNEIKMEEAQYNITGNAVNDEVVYACRPGYRMVGGNDRRVCQRNGSWSGQTPVCDVTSEGLSAIKKELETKLLFNKTNTTLHKLKKISVYEKRVGAVSLGALGIFILIVTLLVIIVPDVSRIFNDFNTLDGHKRPKQMIRTNVIAKRIFEHRISPKQN